MEDVNNSFNFSVAEIDNLDFFCWGGLAIKCSSNHVSYRNSNSIFIPSVNFRLIQKRATLLGKPKMDFKFLLL